MDVLPNHLVLNTIIALVLNPGILNYIKASECRTTTSFENLQTNKALLNHVIEQLTLSSDQMCRIKCYLNNDCVSYNLGPSPTPGMMVCQLNDADRHQYPQDYQERPGYSYRGTENKCTDNPCPSNNQTCQSGFGAEGYRCFCPKGFTGNQCEIDIDECSKALHNCSSKAVCNNTRGSFECVCQVGYQGDGVHCTDADECSSGLHECSPNATCHNDLGSYHCVCHAGFQGNGRKCIDIDECTTGLHNCSANATCNNIIGSFQCVCLPGFEGDGVTCIENWIKANYNTSEVCFGTRGDSFGVFAVPYAGEIKKIKLVYVSGGVAWGGGSRYEGNWGDKDSKEFEIHITNISNQRLAPPADYPLTYKTGLRYQLPGQNFMDPQMIFPDFSPFLRVHNGQVFRVWYGQDLVNFSEDNNSGQTCSHVYVVYGRYET